jgi:hypothetical protein
MQSAERGIVLPVVLVMLLLMTVTVTLLMRRGAVDELIASNVRQVTTLDTAAQHALRTCERLLWVSPPGVPVAIGDPLPPTVVPATVRPPAPTASPPPAWRTAAAADWVALPPADFDDDGNAITPSPVSAALCLFEDASAELELVKSNVSTTATGLNLDNTWRKYRITAEVQGRLDWAGRPNAFGRAQSEVRMNVVGPS